ncbi:hypothetical protein CHGG_07931 [Chaetomium globosum CBS 148.51]|uniref:DUF1783-domain-containing protein n=1 Tax=Chaetomium globosum (strain ATCC 6205 / CBS 148.51 / DSM 1962 / NBRC 6347 / NRRL 1970) TaxID=306901 RepID=Q2GVS3_CHAGB|nr:uncharacterized protein CHGG_07931 [Chaetomium globosum CBS 148.51]EAQ86678.1 hypothetical protein CHGG_07931 [Chaetomium globosum CBS 148.51]
MTKCETVGQRYARAKAVVNAWAETERDTAASFLMYQSGLNLSRSVDSKPPHNPNHAVEVNPAKDGRPSSPTAEEDSLEQTTFRWSRTLPLFAAALIIASISIFNYQKLSSPVVGATLYALRTSEKARAHLGDEIYFAQQIPWISGEMNQLHGRIDITFRVKGTRGGGVMRFTSFRPSPRGMFETTEWSLETDDGVVIDLLEDGDPFKAITGAEGPIEMVDLEEEESSAAATRGFRKMNK